MRDAINALQAERVAKGQGAPSYWASAALPEHALEPGALDAARAGYCVHVTAADALDAEQVAGFVRSAEALAVPLTLVLERTQAHWGNTAGRITLDGVVGLAAGHLRQNRERLIVVRGDVQLARLGHPILSRRAGHRERADQRAHHHDGSREHAPPPNRASFPVHGGNSAVGHCGFGARSASGRKC